MTRQTIYEWDAEQVATDRHPDCDPNEVLNHNHADRLADAVKVTAHDETERIELVLVRDVWADDGDLLDRSWAYVYPDGTLPAFFTDSYGHEVASVPKRFHAEVARTLCAK
jgi:hypothetical protein